MHFHFRTAVRTEESDDPFLGEILADCEVEARVKVHCSYQGDQIDFTGLEIDRIDFCPDDRHSLLKARVLLGDELQERMQVALESQVERHWSLYHEDAAMELDALHEAAMEARYDQLKDR